MNTAEFGDSADDLGDTLTVTVCLDEDSSPADLNDSPFHHPLQPDPAFEPIGPPTTVHDVRLQIDADARVADLPPPAQSALQLRLNPPSIGSMRNWEYLAMLLGMSLDEIVALRRDPNPTGQLARRFADLPLRRFMSTVKDINRVDVLIVLQPFVNAVRANRQALNSLPMPDSGLFETREVAENVQVYQPRQPAAALLDRPQSSSPFQIPANFVLITHHEPGGGSSAEKSARKFFRFFFANAQEAGSRAGVDVLDVDKCVDERNLNETIMQVFRCAQQIVLVASPAYLDHIHNTTDQSEPRVYLKKLLASLMDNEYISRGLQNTRFRVVVRDADDAHSRPIGWATNTLLYKFPDDWPALKRKLFPDSDG